MSNERVRFVWNAIQQCGTTATPLWLSSIYLKLRNPRLFRIKSEGLFFVRKKWRLRADTNYNFRFPCWEHAIICCRDSISRLWRPLMVIPHPNHNVNISCRPLSSRSSPCRDREVETSCQDHNFKNFWWRRDILSRVPRRSLLFLHLRVSLNAFHLSTFAILSKFVIW